MIYVVIWTANESNGLLHIVELIWFIQCDTIFGDNNAIQIRCLEIWVRISVPDENFAAKIGPWIDQFN